MQKSVGLYLTETMQSALGDHPNIGEIRGDGMLCAVDLVADRKTRATFEPSAKIAPSVVSALLARGVIARAMPQSDIIGFAPPLCLSVQEADMVVTATLNAIKEILPEQTKGKIG